METILIILIGVCFLFILFSSVYNSFQSLAIKINEAEVNIDSILRKRYDLLNKASNIIESKTEDKKVITSITNLKSKKISNFELDRLLYEGLNQYIIYLEEDKNLKSNETLIKIGYEMTESEHEINSYRKYYNDTITRYNKKVRKFPTLFIALIFGFKTKLYYDNKDMSDEVINDFKL